MGQVACQLDRLLGAQIRAKGVTVGPRRRRQKGATGTFPVGRQGTVRASEVNVGTGDLVQLANKP